MFEDEQFSYDELCMLSSAIQDKLEKLDAMVHIAPDYAELVQEKIVQFEALLQKVQEYTGDA